MTVKRESWTPERIARLGFLIGLGNTAREVAADPAIASTLNNVHRQSQRFGLSFRASRPEPFAPKVEHRLSAAAAKRGIDRPTLLQAIIAAAASDDALLENVLDDAEDVTASAPAPSAVSAEVR